MKRILFVIIISLCFISVKAEEKIEVKLDKCVDGDTAWFIYKNKSEKFRFLAINTPESTNKIEKYGKEASKFTCNELSNATKIEIEFDLNSNKKDKYGRYLAWVFVDNDLLQEKLINNGYAQIKYIYGDYLYLDRLKKSENKAKNKKIGIYNDKDVISNDKIIIIIGVIIFIILFLFNQKYRKKFIRKSKKEIKNKFNKILKKIH